tara:strand:+ start:1105 stop:1704 length:600 start_codon:yes stop_codon:yes gene_type:complete
MTYQGQMFKAAKRVPLTKRSFAKGALYVSVESTLMGVDLMDIRYWMEDGANLMPTPKGFRITADQFSKWTRLLNVGATQLREESFKMSKARELRVRFVNDDKYGTGVDVRYYAKSDRYTGWERKGIRFSLTDWETFRKELLMVLDDPNKLDAASDLFEGKEIVVKERKQKSGGKRNSTSSSLSGHSYINPGILKLLEEL